MNWDQFKHGRATVAPGVQLHYRQAGEGTPVVLLHGWPQHSLMWHTVAPDLAKHHTVIAPDLRGAGGSSITKGGYEKKTMASDVHALMTSLGHERYTVVGYDLGSGVAFSLAAQQREAVERLVVMEFGLPGFGYEQVMAPTPDWDAGANWHLGFFTVPEVAEFAFRGRERELLTWFFWHLSCNPSSVAPEHFDEYVRQVAKPGALRAGIEYYAAVWQDAEDNKQLAAERLELPVLAVGGEASSGAFMKQLWEPVAANVDSVSIPGAGHWLGDENPEGLVEALQAFLRSE